MNDNLGYSPKDLVFGEEGRSKLISGISKISNAVKSTLGPRGNTVLIESPNHTHGITVTKDGVTVAKSIDLIDPIENLAVKIMKQAADKTATEVGDGTSSSIVLTEALVLEGTKRITPELNRTVILNHMVDITNTVVENLKRSSRKLSKGMLLDVATISANNDREIGKIIADAYKKVGKNGIVTIEKSQTTETTSSYTNGIKIGRGYTSPMFINDFKRDECVFEDTYILVSDTEISNILQLENVLKPIIKDNKKLLIISPCNNNVITTLAMNVVKNGFKMCNIAPPSFGYRQHELMSDIALSVGAKYFSEKTGDDLSLITHLDLGHASKVIVGKDSTIIIKDQSSENQPEIDARVLQLKEAYNLANKKSDKDFISERIASLQGGISVISVGGNTDLEQKELYDRVDDAVCAVRSALEEGIVAGGGKALYDVIGSTPMIEYSKESYVAQQIMYSSLRVPMTQIIANAGLNINDMAPLDNTRSLLDTGYGYDVKNYRWGDMIDMGIIDPLKVVRCSLQNAVSVAVTLLSTNAIVTMARSYEAN